MGLFKSIGKAVKKVGSAVGKAAKTVGKVAGKALQVVGPVASMIPGVGSLVGTAANIVGGILSPSGGGAQTGEVPVDGGGTVEVPYGAAVGYAQAYSSGGGGGGGIGEWVQRNKAIVIGGGVALAGLVAWLLFGRGRRRF